MEEGGRSRRTRRPARVLKFVPTPLELPPYVHLKPWSNTSTISSGGSNGAGLHHNNNGGNYNSINEGNSLNKGNTPTGKVEIHSQSSPPPPAPVVVPTRAVNLMTERLLEMFAQCNAAFKFDRRLNPRRVLTKPARPTYNSGHDNEKHDYILYVNDTLGNEEGRKYVILDLLGQGTFGQVVKCQNVKTRELVAVKVIKNQPAFFNQSMMEVTVLEMLNQKYDKNDLHHIVRMRDTFVYRQHLCIVVELLSLNLYELIKQNQYRGFSLTLCRIFLQQILDALQVLKEARIIHCDLKPENVLLKNLESPSVKVIDYGSACHEHQTLYTYIQSRFYRSPEVLLGLPYSASIDMWSLGCISAELFLGLPIFPGASNYDQVNRIVQTLGLPPTHMLEVGKETLTYFERVRGVDGGRGIFQLKSRERYSLETNRVEPPPKQYFSSTKLEEIILNYPMRPRDMSNRDREAELAGRRCFLDFVRGCLNINPIERWSPLQAAQHPFITGKSFTGHFVPPIATAPIPVGVALSGTVASGVNPSTSTRVKVGMGRPRPRANTLSSLSLQEVPPQIQRITAANRDKGATGVGPAERTDAIPEVATGGVGGGGDSSLISEGATLLSLPFETGSAYSPSGMIDSSGGGTPTGEATIAMTTTTTTATGDIVKLPLPPPQPSGALGTERVTAYVSNRRVSQPAVGRYAPRASNAGLPYNPSGAIPASVPNAVWYGPEPTFGMDDTINNSNNSSGGEGNIIPPPQYSNFNAVIPNKSRSIYYSSPRRGSLKAEPSGMEVSIPNAAWNRSPNSQNAPLNTIPSTTGRRASAPTIQVEGSQLSRGSGRNPSTLSLSIVAGVTPPITLSSPPLDENSEVARRRGSSSSSMMDVLDEEAED